MIAATTTTAQNCKICAQNVYVAISGCQSLSQSPENSFFELGVAENPRFATEILILSVIVPEINISDFGGHTAISDYRWLSQSLGDTLVELAMVENAALAVGISMVSLLVSEI